MLGSSRSHGTEGPTMHCRITYVSCLPARKYSSSCDREPCGRHWQRDRASIEWPMAKGRRVAAGVLAGSRYWEHPASTQAPA
jgi:hypothetical protein